MTFTRCNRCNDTTRESVAVDGLCEACHSLESTGDVVEVPQPVLEKLVGMASTRHPTPCNEVAPRYKQILEQEELL